MAPKQPNALFAAQEPPARRSRLSSVIPWGMFLLALAAAGTLYVLHVRPMQEAHARLMQTFNERGVELEKVRADLTKLRAKHAHLASERDRLGKELDKTEAEKEAALEELKRTQRELSSKLEEEIAAGEVLIERRGDRLVVDVADKILFPKGEADVTEQGQAVLKQVADTLGRLETHVFEVGGHTDNAPIVSPDVSEHYPTNWELSAARATNVVRFLQTDGKIPGKKLIAAAFAEYRPAASNRSASGRKRNRRIEIVLRRPRQN